jgi:hypothetical protein
MSSPAASRCLRVFLCHASIDKSRVRQLYQHLRDVGVDPWFDEENLLPGQDWELEIRRVVRATDVVLVCLSQQAVSQRGFRHKEIVMALDIADEQPEGTIFIIPVKLEECPIPDRLRRWHWVNLFDEQGFQRLFRALQQRANELGVVLNPPEPPPPGSPPPEHASVAVVGKVTVGHLEILLKNAGTHWWLQARNISQTEIQAVTIQATPSQTINSSPRLFEVRRLSSDESSEDMSIALHKVRNEFIEQQKIELSHAIEHVQKRIRVLQRRMGSAEPIQRARHKQDIEDQQEALAGYQEMWDELMQPEKVELQMLVSYKADNTDKIEQPAIQALPFML